jgi:ubiquinol-cytochrome c reductase cytochrome b subunit
LGGVLAMGGAIVGLMALPYINTSEVRSSVFRPLYRKFFWLFFVNALILGWIGQNVVEYPYVEVGQASTIFYFGFLFVIIPLLGWFERAAMRVELFISWHLLSYRRSRLAVEHGGCAFES